ncbi:MAG TPA: OmpH family outer membrane protein [Wenzhouxiangella sp.]|nr:OmpH family outer membrane protein [Wenzhouxiangella sp.]
MDRIVQSFADNQRSAQLWRRLCLLAASLVLAGLASAQDARIGYVDMKRLFDAAPQVVSARQALDDEFSPRNQLLLTDEARLQRLENELASSGDLDDEQRFETEREIRNLRRSIERRREDLAEELRFRTNAEKKALEKTIEVAVEQVAEEGGYDMILSSPVAWASDRIDITDEILEWLKEDFENEQRSQDQQRSR